MVGCSFTGQGKKGDCVGKKVNGGPVVHGTCTCAVWQELLCNVNQFLTG